MTAVVMPTAADSLREKAEDSLRDKANALEFALPEVLWDLVPAAAYACDVQGTIVRFNRRAAQLWGRAPKLLDPLERFCGAYRLYRLDGSLLPHPECPMADVLLTGDIVRDQEVMIERPDGSRIIAVVNIEPLRDGKGAIIGAINCFQDISDRKRAEAALQESERKSRASEQIARQFAAIVQSSDDAILSINLASIIISCNGAAERLYGYMAEDVVGQPITILIPADRLHEEGTIIDRIRLGERVDHYETVRRRKDGSLVDVSLSVSPLKNAEGGIIGASKIARDITERIRSEAQIATLAREAEHRAKNILATVQATAHLTHADTVEDFKQALTGRIQALANVHALFAQSRWAGADVRTLALQELSPYCQGEQGRAHIDGPDIMLETGTAQMVGVCLHELATNAAKYGALSRPQGRIRIAWSRTPDARLVLSWTETGGPPVAPPSRRGFGTRVMKQMVEGQFKGEMRLDWRPECFACELTFAM
jgi:PAS domain S-box-containing protein